MTVLQLYNQITSLPGHLQKKVSEYVDFLLFQSNSPKKGKPRTPGLAKGMLVMKDNFDDPIEDFNDYM